MYETMTLQDLPVGFTVHLTPEEVYGLVSHRIPCPVVSRSWVVADVRRHAMTEHDGTAWLILEGWKEAGMGDFLRIPLDTQLCAVASFS